MELCEREREFFRFLYLGPNRPTPPTNNNIVYPFN